MANEVVHMELKYCERCGGLWLRATDSGCVYCTHCDELMRQMAPSSLHRTHPRPPGSIISGSEIGPADALDPLEGVAEWLAPYGLGGAA